MKKLIALLLICTLALSLAACTTSTGTGNKDLDKEVDEAMDTLKAIISNAATQTDEGSDTTDSNSWLFPTSSGVSEPVDPKTVDYSKIDYELGFDDGSKMKDFMNDVQAGKYDNKVVKITGIMSTGNLDKTTNSVMLNVGDGVKLGVQWRIVDSNDSTVYPGDDNKIEITGVVLSEFNEAWGMYGHYIYVLPENAKDLGAIE